MEGLHRALLITTMVFFLGINCAISKPSEKAVEFIRTSCDGAEYPHLCFSSLSSYASTVHTSPIKLANTALRVTLSSAKATSGSMDKLSRSRNIVTSHIQVQVMKDCVENVGSSIDQLRRSVSEMRNLGGQSLGFQISNIQTWVSAALTDANTCMTGFSGKSMNGPLKTAVRVKIVYLVRLTSNALSLVNSLTGSE